MLLIVLFFGTAWIRPLSHPDEGRYVRIPQEMVEAGDYVTPRLNGVDYFYKPPLFYWLQAVPLQLSGTSEWGLRFFPALAALMTCMAVFFAARRLWSAEVGWLAAFLLATAGMFYGMSQIIILDMVLTAGITGALLCYLCAIDRERDKWRAGLFIMFYCCLAAAVMTKGLVGLVIPGAVIGIWTLACRRWGDVFKIHLIPGIILFLALVAPWHILATLANPGQGSAGFFSSDPTGQGFAWFYFWHEHVLRYIDEGSADRGKAWWYFLMVTPLGLLPWAVFLPGCLIQLWQKRQLLSPKPLFLILWAVFPVAFFSLSSSKLPPYILPSLPPLAMLLAWYGGQCWQRPERLKAGLYILAAGAMIASIAAPIIIEGREQTPDAILPILIVVALILFIGGFATLIWTLKNQYRRAAGAAMLTALLFCLCFNPLAVHLQRPSTKAFAEWINDKDFGDAAIFTVFDYYQDFPVYLGRSISIAENSPKEQEFGRLRGEHEHRFVSAEILKDHLKDQDRVIILIEIRYLDYFYSLIPEALLYEYKRDDFFLLAGNRPLD